MRLSVILPTYNQEKYLSRCLDSLLSQSLDPDTYEIIIVNDGSSDNTREIAEDYVKRHQQINLINKENAGAGAARNTGLDAAKGAYIHFVDPDDYIARDVYPILLEITEHTDPDILTFKFEKTKKSDLTEARTDLSAYDMSQLKTISGVAFIASTNYRNTVWWYFLKKDFFVQNNFRFIEGKWMEDSILTPRIFLKAKRVTLSGIDVYRYMITPNSAMTSKDPKHYNKLIGDIEHATFSISELLKELESENPQISACRDRIKTRQQSFVFFLLVRLMKSNMPINTIPEKLKGFKSIEAYPLDEFGGKDFIGYDYKLLTYVFNREFLMYPFMKFFRFFYRPLQKFKLV